jgi:hypothetical protein
MQHRRCLAVVLVASAGGADINAQVCAPCPCGQDIGHYGPVVESYSHIHVSGDRVHRSYSISGKHVVVLVKSVGPNSSFF